jgi:endonuclease YncB( thermonuclease family)
MWRGVGTFVGCALVCFFCGGTVRAQNGGVAKPGIDLDYSKDPCGNPLMESQAWIGIEGRVSQVVDGNTILIAVTLPPKTLRVPLVGTAADRSGPFSRSAKEFLREKLLNKLVGVLVKPDWFDRQPKAVTGVVYLREGPIIDPGLALLAQGLARAKHPQPYTMSEHKECEYLRAQAEAKSKKLGMWR